MIWKKSLTHAELAEEVDLATLELAAISEEQAENSDVNGDSDAEDVIPDYYCNTIALPPSTIEAHSDTPTSESEAPSQALTPSCSGYSSTTSSRSSKRRRTNLGTPTQQSEDFYDFDSDDSITDKTYTPLDKLQTQHSSNELLHDSDSEQENIDVTLDFDRFCLWEKSSVLPQTFNNYNFDTNVGPNVQVIVIYIFRFCINIYVNSNSYFRLIRKSLLTSSIYFSQKSF